MSWFDGDPTRGIVHHFESNHFRPLDVVTQAVRPLNRKDSIPNARFIKTEIVSRGFVQSVQIGVVER